MATLSLVKGHKPQVKILRQKKKGHKRTFEYVYVQLCWTEYDDKNHFQSKSKVIGKLEYDSPTPILDVVLLALWKQDFLSKIELQALIYAQKVK